MAQTPQQILNSFIGDLVMTIANLRGENEQLREAITELTKQVPTTKVEVQDGGNPPAPSNVSRFDRFDRPLQGKAQPHPEDQPF